MSGSTNNNFNFIPIDHSVQKPSISTATIVWLIVGFVVVIAIVMAVVIVYILVIRPGATSTTTTSSGVVLSGAAFGGNPNKKPSVQPASIRKVKPQSQPKQENKPKKVIFQVPEKPAQETKPKVAEIVQKNKEKQEDKLSQFIDDNFKIESADNGGTIGGDIHAGPVSGGIMNSEENKGKKWDQTKMIPETYMESNRPPDSLAARYGPSTAEIDMYAPTLRDIYNTATTETRGPMFVRGMDRKLEYHDIMSEYDQKTPEKQSDFQREGMSLRDFKARLDEKMFKDKLTPKRSREVLAA